MRTTIFIAIALAVATAVCAGPYEKTVKYDTEEKWTPLNVKFDEVNAEAYLSEVYTGQVKKGKVRFADNTNYGTEYKNVTVTNVGGDSAEMSTENALVGMFQFIDVYPETDKCQFELKFAVSGELKNRIGHGLVKPANFVPVGGGVKNTGSVVSTKDAEDPGFINYNDQSDKGWTVSYDKDTGVVTLTGTSDAFVDFDSGCFDLGVIIVK
jgi:hypothetical protein